MVYETFGKLTNFKILKNPVCIEQRSGSYKIKLVVFYNNFCIKRIDLKQLQILFLNLFVQNVIQFY